MQIVRGRSVIKIGPAKQAPGVYFAFEAPADQRIDLRTSNPGSRFLDGEQLSAEYGSRGEIAYWRDALAEVSCRR